jgi:hypothetical protein
MNPFCDKTRPLPQSPRSVRKVCDRTFAREHSGNVFWTRKGGPPPSQNGPFLRIEEECHGYFAPWRLSLRCTVRDMTNMGILKFAWAKASSVSGTAGVNGKLIW